MSDTLEILDKVNGFYNAAFYDLITFTVALLAFVGVLIPVAISFHQSKQLKIQKDELKSYLRAEIVEIEVSLKNKVEEFLNAESEKIKREIERVEKSRILGSQLLDGKIHHMIGNIEFQNKNHKTALENYIYSATSYAKAASEDNLMRVMTAITNNCLPNIYEDIKDEIGLDASINNMISAIHSVNQNNRYNDMISTFHKGYKESNNRKRAIQSFSPGSGQ